MVPTTGAGPSGSIVGNALERGFGITPVTDHFLSVVGLEAILADGSVYRSPLAALGGTSAHPFKWGIGPYVDGLFAQGSFGVVTSMTVALARRPEVIAVFLCGIKRPESLADLVSAIREGLTRLPAVVGGVNLMNARRVFAMSAPYPAEHSPTDGVIPDALLERLCRRRAILPWTVFGTLYGTRRMVAAARSEIKRTIGTVASRLVFLTPGLVDTMHHVARRVPGLRSNIGRTLNTLRSSMDLVSGRPNETALPLAYWRSRKGEKDGAPLDPARDETGLIWYAPLVEMKHEQVVSYVRFVTDTMSAHGREPLITLTSLSERCFASTVPILFDQASAEERDAAWRCYDQLLTEGAARGFLPYRVGIQSMGWLMRQAPAHWKLVSALKGTLDPDGLLAPGRYAPTNPTPDR
jgi:FAD/FMN-containing dehydrogenase